MKRHPWVWAKRFLLALVVLIILGSIGLAIYVKPEASIGWAPPVHVSLRERVEAMIDQRAFEIKLTEDEINGYASEWMLTEGFQKPEIKRWNLQGLQIESQDEVLHLRVAAKPWLGLDVGVNLDMKQEFEASSGIIKLIPMKLYVKDIELSLGWFDLKTIEVNPADYMSEWVKVKSVQFGDHYWNIRLGLRL